MTATIHHGDCLDVLRSMPDNSVDAVVCDPPYGLSNTTPDKVTNTIVRWAQGDREHVPQGKGFMGASWDAFVPPVAVWDECLRVLKPGGHLVAFAGSRTQDLMGLSIRLAGFDIRENVAWLYGSGFPKSHDISKGIDKARKDNSAWKIVGAWLKGHRESAGYTRQSIAPLLGGHSNVDSAAANMSNWENGLSFPTWERWEELSALIQFPDEMDAEVWRLNGRKGTPGENWDKREVIGTRTTGIGTGKGGTAFISDSDNRDITKAHTPEAEKWQGFGTALKPAHEPIIMARKPFPGTVASNVLEHGTGGLNIDATRIGPKTDVPFKYAAKAPKKERPTYKRAVLRLRDDLTPEQVDHVRARLLEAGVSPE